MRFLNTNKKKNIFVFLFAFFIVGSGFFLTDVHTASADEYRPCGLWDFNCGIVGVGLDAAGGAIGNVVVYAFKWLLYGFFTVCGWMLSLAVTIFEWIIQPKYFTILFNASGVYESWKFIRDFFNIFFIFGLLYIAFTTVFQIQKNFKKAMLTLVLAALFVNFSFPISRALIDTTNVPMYFFVNQMMARNEAQGVGIFGATLTASHILPILIPGSEKGWSINLDEIDVSRLLISIVFLFILSVTMLVLAVMFVIRLVALVILVIFSSVGFVAFIIPGMESYAKMWWDNFWKYALYGPAAMLLLVVATRFFSELGDINGPLVAGLQNVAGSTVIGVERDFFASMALFSIPIIMLWFAMGLANRFSIAGAATISGKGEKFAKWVGKKTYDNPLGRGLGGGIKERAENNKFAKYLTPKYWGAPSGVEAGIKGGIMGAGNDGVRAGWTNARTRLAEDQHNKQVTEEEKKMEEARTSETQLRATMADRSGRYSKAQVEAATRILSKKDKLQNAADMDAAAAAMQYANRGMNPATAQEKTAELIKKAGGEIYQTGADLATAIGRLGTDTKAITALIDKAEKDALNTMTLATYSGYSPAIQGKLSGKMKKEGAIRVLVEEKVTGGATRNAAVTDVMTSMKPEDAAKVFKDPLMRLHATAYLAGIMGTNPERYTKIKADV